MGLFAGREKVVSGRWLGLMMAGVLGGMAAMPYPCAGQTSSNPSTIQSPSQNSGGGPQPPSLNSGIPGTQGPGGIQGISPATPGIIQTPAATPLPGTANTLTGIAQSSTPGLTFAPPPVGRGLPGMPGGPPLNSSMGASDPS